MQQLHGKQEASWKPCLPRPLGPAAHAGQRSSPGSAAVRGCSLDGGCGSGGWWRHRRDWLRVSMSQASLYTLLACMARGTTLQGPREVNQQGWTSRKGLERKGQSGYGVLGGWTLGFFLQVRTLPFSLRPRNTDPRSSTTDIEIQPPFFRPRVQAPALFPHNLGSSSSHLPSQPGV